MGARHGFWGWYDGRADSEDTTYRVEFIIYSPIEDRGKEFIMTKYTVEEMKAMLDMGFTHEQIVAMSNDTVSTVGAKTTKTTKAKTPTGSKPKTTKSKAKTTNDFDRSLYEVKAKELGCFAYGKVVATVVDGKVIRTAKENRDLVYKAMGIK